MSPIFYFLALLTLGGAVAAMSLRNPVHGALCLVATFAGLAGIYLALGAQFVGLAQVLVYIGAVAILLVFVLLLTRNEGSEGGSRGGPGWRWGLLVSALVTVVLGASVAGRPGLPPRTSVPESPTVKGIGEALMTDFVLPLEVVGVLLTAAMIGAAVLAQQEPPPARCATAPDSSAPTPRLPEAVTTVRNNPGGEPIRAGGKGGHGG